MTAISFKTERRDRGYSSLIRKASQTMSSSRPGTMIKERTMVPFVVLITSFVLLSVLGHFGLPFSYGWRTSLSVALSGMFLLTASEHWGKRRPDLIRMIPSAFPHAEMLVTATGVLEILGAVGLMIPMLSRYAALGLSLLLIAVFPANVRAARHRLAIAGRPVPGLFARALIQMAFLAATVAVLVGGR